MSFTRYEQLVKAGGGEIQIAAVDETTDDQNNKLLTFHPENGFAYVFVDSTVHLPEELNTISGIYFGINEKGQFVIVRNSLSADVLSSIRAEGSKLGYQPDYGVGYQLQAKDFIRIRTCI